MRVISRVMNRGPQWGDYLILENGDDAWKVKPGDVIRLGYSDNPNVAPRVGEHRVYRCDHESGVIKLWFPVSALTPTASFGDFILADDLAAEWSPYP